MILPVRGRDPHAIRVTHFAACCDEPIGDVSELLAVVAGDGIAIPIESGAREADLARFNATVDIVYPLDVTYRSW